MSGILIAGLGNIFKGDDAFGSEVVQWLAHRGLAPHVKAVEFGSRGIDLTYALLDGYDAAVLVDTVQRGGRSRSREGAEARERDGRRLSSDPRGRLANRLPLSMRSKARWA